jgi:hypothetical protein
MIRSIATLLALLPTSVLGASPVSDSGQLADALAAAEDGQVILLQPGDYGDLTISNRRGASVSLKAVVAGEARFSGIRIVGSSGITLEGLHVSSAGNGTTADALLDIVGSEGITIRGSELNALEDDVRPIAGYFGIRAKNSGRIVVEGNFVHDVLNGMAFFGSTELIVRNNSFDNLGSDGLKFGGVSAALIEGNTGPRSIFSNPKAHEDFIQFQGRASQDITIRGNLFLPENIADVQGIFVAGNGGHRNILIESNSIYTGMANGIYVAADSSNVVIRNNTLLNADSDLLNAVTRITAPSSARIENNIYTDRRGGYDGSNLVVQRADPAADYYAPDLFPDFLFGGTNDRDSLTPLAGSAAEGKGAASPG